MNNVIILEVTKLLQLPHCSKMYVNTGPDLERTVIVPAPHKLLNELFINVRDHKQVILKEMESPFINDIKRCIAI